VVTLCTDVVERGSTPAAAYNVAGGKPITVRELLGALVAAAGLPKDFPIRELPGSPNDQFGLYAEIRRAREDFGWTPTVDLASGLRGMVQWARASQAG